MSTITTLPELIAKYLPPGHPVAENDYWANLLERAALLVKAAVGRNLAEDTYTDAGYLRDKGVHWFWRLREPTGVAIPYEQFTEITLDGITVPAEEVNITPTIIEFLTGYENQRVKITYPGGFCRTTEHAHAIKSEIARVLLALHHQMEMAGIDSTRGAVPFSIPRAGELMTEISRHLAQYVVWETPNGWV
ncbi:hypothetical protein [Thermogutta sp.]|uniref:hypothetical protein n=1 Tax=Thermogutta sp. TaxID=1962930 RepID=UPI00321FCB16